MRTCKRASMHAQAQSCEEPPPAPVRVRMRACVCVRVLAYACVCWPTMRQQLNPGTSIYAQSIYSIYLLHLSVHASTTDTVALIGLARRLEDFPSGDNVPVHLHLPRVPNHLPPLRVHTPALALDGPVALGLFVGAGALLHARAVVRRLRLVHYRHIGRRLR